MTGRMYALVSAWLLLGLAGAACNHPDDTKQRREDDRTSPVAEEAEETEANVEAPNGGASGEAPRGDGPSDTAAVADTGEVIGTTKPSTENPAPVPVPVPDLYDAAIIPHIQLTFDDAAMAVLSSTDPATRETWVHGSFTMDAITFADVGVRRKGASTFRALPQKASLKVKLNKWVKGQKVYGLTELTLNNMMGNPTFIAERLALHFFRSLRLPAQRANTAHLTINGEDYGIYANIETPDEKFLTRVFGPKANTLYEVNFGGPWLPGAERSFEIDVADPNAPLGARPDAALLFQSVQAARDESLLADLAPNLHTTEWLRYSAAEGILGQRDGYAYSIYGSHNYFMAGDTDGKFSLIPWSVDSTLYDFNGVVLDAAMPTNEVVLARCKRTAACWDVYKAEMSSVLAVYESLDLITLAKSWHTQIDPLVKADPKREAGDGTYARRKSLLYEWLDSRPGIVRAQLGL